MEPVMPPDPEPIPPPTPEVVRPAAFASLNIVAADLDRAMAGVARGRATAETWADDFWEVSGYDKTAVLAAFDTLDTLVETYNTQYVDAINVLKNQGAS